MRFVNRNGTCFTESTTICIGLQTTSHLNYIWMSMFPLWYVSSMQNIKVPQQIYRRRKRTMQMKKPFLPWRTIGGDKR